MTGWVQTFSSVGLGSNGWPRFCLLVCLFIWLVVCGFVCLFVWLFVGLFVWLVGCLLVCLFIWLVGWFALFCVGSLCLGHGTVLWEARVEEPGPNLVWFDPQATPHEPKALTLAFEGRTGGFKVEKASHGKCPKRTGAGKPTRFPPSTKIVKALSCKLLREKGSRDRESLERPSRAKQLSLLNRAPNFETPRWPTHKKFLVMDCPIWNLLEDERASHSLGSIKAMFSGQSTDTSFDL